MEKVISAPPWTAIRTPSLKRSHLSTQSASQAVSEQVNKVSRIFKQRDAVSRDLIDSLATVSEQASYLERQMKELEMKNSSITSRKELQSAVFQSLRSQIKNYGKNHVDPIVTEWNQFGSMMKRNEDTKHEMAADLEEVCYLLSTTCRLRLDELVTVVEAEKTNQQNLIDEVEKLGSMKGILDTQCKEKQVELDLVTRELEKVSDHAQVRITQFYTLHH